MITSVAALLAVLVLAPVFFFAVYRPWHLRWGATAAEVNQRLPADGTLFESSFTATRAVTVRARPEDVWPWLVQIGFGRAGWYSYDWLDNLGRPSAERILPELQALQVGDFVPMSAKIDERTAFRVAAIEPHRTLLWAKPDSTWVWVLERADEHHTRVLMRLRCRHDLTSLPGVAGMLLMELGDFPMCRKLLLNLRRRAEGLARARAAGVAGPAV